MIAHKAICRLAAGCTSAVASACLVACGGGSNTPFGSFVGSTGGHAPPPTQLVAVQLTVSVSATGRPHLMHPSYISPNTQSVSVQLASVDGNGVSGVSASVVNTTPNSHNCKVRGNDTVCTATIQGSPGADVFNVATYGAANATGAILSVGTASAQIGKGGGGLPISNELSIAIDGVIASLSVAISPNRAKRGDPATAGVTLHAYDASGAQIVGASNYQSPIELSIQGDATHSFTLHGAGASGSSLSIEKPASGITLSYDGSPQASSITLAATAPGDPGMNAPFVLHGHRPPPPPGTIYVLNMGAKNGLGATVTEYDGNATGNVAPLRTLGLNAKLYARSIDVDGAGNLDVGYFDSEFGFDGSNLPDSGNLVAIFAPGASGNDQPVSTLVADPSTSTLLYPLFGALNAAGGLVTYGATSVDRNAGDAVLTYPKGATGMTPPQSGLDFAFPTISYGGPYAGPTGLALDASGNVYYAGALHGSLGPSFGIFVAAAADIGNPQANPSRTIPWDDVTKLTPFQTSNVGIDSSGEILVATQLVSNPSSNTSCQGKVNVYAAGADSGVTDEPPLRTLTLAGVYTQNPDCVSFTSLLQPYFPEIALYGSTLFVADDFNNAIGTFSSGKGGTVKPTHRIAGAATGLNAPIAVFVAPSSDRVAARPVRNGRMHP
ncbi:MAG: hypothetical protein WCD38_08765 [Candidatus Tumulicola sp.]